MENALREREVILRAAFWRKAIALEQNQFQVTGGVKYGWCGKGVWCDEGESEHGKVWKLTTGVENNCGEWA